MSPERRKTRKGTNLLKKSGKVFTLKNAEPLSLISAKNENFTIKIKSQRTFSNWKA